MEAATQPQAYEHSQTIFGLAVARHSFRPGGNGQTAQPCQRSCPLWPIVGSIDVSAFRRLFRRCFGVFLRNRQ